MATATSKLQIIIDVLGNPSNRGVLTDIRSGLDLVSTAFDKVGQYAQKAYQFINEGADIELAERKFDRLAQTIGATGDALMKDLGPAVGGLISQADQMALAGDIMSLGLASTQEQAVRLTGAVSQLGADMNQVVLSLTNQTTARFDQIGIAVKGFDEKLAALEAQGYSTDEAFTWAFIEQAEAQIEKVGSVADTTAGKLMQLEADWKNLTDEAKRSASDGLGPFIGKVADARLALAALNELYDRGAISTGEYLKYQLELHNPLADTGAILGELSAAQDEYNAMMERSYDISYRFGGSQQYVSNASEDNIHIFEQSAGVVDFYAQRAQEAARASYAHGTALRDEQSAQVAVNETLSVAGKRYSEVSTNVYGLTQSIQDQLDFLSAGGGALLELAQTAQQALDEGNFSGAQEALDAAALGAIDLDLELGKIDTDTAVQRLVDMGYPIEDAIDQVARLQESLYALTTRSYAVTVNLAVAGGNPGSPGGYVAPTPDGQGIPLPPVTGGGAGGQTGGGGGDYAQSVGFSTGGGTVVNWYGNVVVPSADEAMAFLAMMMETGRRSNATAAAGGGYAG